jgi:ABC-2 type transport system ATP-binding protein
LAAIIEARGLTRLFGQRVAVEDLALTIERGEVFGLLGPNGAGKTTVVRMLSGLIAPSAGDATVRGIPVYPSSPALRANVGLLTEAPGLWDRLGAEANLLIYAQLYDVPHPHTQVEKYLRDLNLWDRRHEPTGGFSKGLRQRLAIARAMLHDPPVLYLDEPTSGLDPHAAHKVRDYILHLRARGRAIVLTTHNLADAERLCDRVGLIRQRLLAVGTPAGLGRRIVGSRTAVRCTQPPQAYHEMVIGLPYVTSASVLEGELLVDLPEPEVLGPSLVRALVEVGVDVQSVRPVHGSLEDVYLAVMQDEADTNGTA